MELPVRAILPAGLQQLAIDSQDQVPDKQLPFGGRARNHVQHLQGIGNQVSALIRQASRGNRLETTLVLALAYVRHAANTHGGHVRVVLASIFRRRAPTPAAIRQAVVVVPHLLLDRLVRRHGRQFKRRFRGLHSSHGWFVGILILQGLGSRHGRFGDVFVHRGRRRWRGRPASPGTDHRKANPKQQHHGDDSRNPPAGVPGGTRGCNGRDTGRTLNSHHGLANREDIPDGDLL